MAEKILVTGFEGFRTQKHNPTSEILLPAIAEEFGDAVETLTLPVTHDVAGDIVTRTIAELQPPAVVMFGVRPGKRVSLETQARNWRTSLLIPDNAGQRRLGRIDRLGPDVIESTLRLERVRDALDHSAVPYRMSRGAGSFLCNEVMYRALQQAGIQNQDAEVGFIHIGARMPDAVMTKAGNAIVASVLDKQ